jgi:hypothetical protein
MRRQIFAYPVVLLLLNSPQSFGEPLRMSCTHAQNRMISEVLVPGTSLPEVVSYLRQRQIWFRAFDEDEQKVDLAGLDENQIALFGKLTLGIVSRFERKMPSLVSSSELLIIEFSSEQKLHKYNCKKIYTGP